MTLKVIQKQKKMYQQQPANDIRIKIPVSSEMSACIDNILCSLFDVVAFA